MFITFEGPDGSGKSTQIELLKGFLKEKGYDVVISREPGGCPLSEEVRRLLLDPAYEVNPVAEALLYAAARAQHVTEVIKPALEAGKMVLCDRFIHSSLAYQGYGRGLGEEMVMTINRPALQGIWPDATFFFDLSVADALERKSAQKELDRLESAGEDFHGRVIEGFRSLCAKMPEMVRLDASETVEKIQRKIRTTIELNF